MTNYTNPYEMLGISYEAFMRLPKETQTKQWEIFKAHVKSRGFSGLLQEYRKEKEERGSSNP